MTKHAFDKIMTGAREARAAIPFLLECEYENIINAIDRRCRIGAITAKPVSFCVEPTVAIWSTFSDVTSWEIDVNPPMSWTP